jgi:ABC-type antimicrobial peptide transport system permease subunit
MIKNYFKIAFRNLLRNKEFSFINVFGLALGVASSLILFLVARNELTYDSFHKKADRIYRVTLNALDFNSSVSLAVLPAMRTDFPELQNATQTFYYSDALISLENEKFLEKGLAFGDEEFFKVFDYEWLAGNPLTALNEPNTIVLTESIVQRYFGEKDAIGKVIKLNNNYNLKVTGVIKDVPANTSTPFAMIASWATIKGEFKNAMTNFYSIPGGYAFIVLPENYPVSKLQSRMQSFIAKNWGKELANGAKLPLQPLRDIHFDQRYINNMITPTGKETYWALAGVAVFIIITACINFINLATAQAVKRAREVGVRKVLGAYRFQLVMQFLGETTILVLFSVGIALVATQIFLPLSGRYLDIKIGAEQLIEPGVLALIGGITLFMILAAGLYPAFVQSAFIPVKALKAQNSTPSSQSLILRKSLVVVQFAISQVLIIGTVVVARQMDFFKNRDLGFNKEAIVSVGIPDPKKGDYLRTEIGKVPGVKDISLSSGGPGYNNNFTSFSCKELGLLKDDVTEVKFIDENYLRLFEMKLLAGEGITAASRKDTSLRLIINETLMKKLGIQDPQKAVGKRLEVNGPGAYPIKGVIKDFQSESKHKKVRACVLAYMPDGFGIMSVKLNSQNLTNTISSIDKRWTATFPESVFEYQFLDDRIAAMYKQEENMYKAFQLFSAIAIFIGCLGLYGLISFVALQKVKEIGIRKVLGASTTDILNLFSSGYVTLIIISFCIAAPTGYYFMNNWLQNFAYHININWHVFVIAAFASVIIAAVTVIYRSIRAAVANPVKSLRTE